MADAMADAAMLWPRAISSGGASGNSTYFVRVPGSPRTVAADRHEREGRVLSERREETFRLMPFIVAPWTDKLSTRAPGERQPASPGWWWAAANRHKDLHRHGEKLPYCYACPTKRGPILRSLFGRLTNWWIVEVPGVARLPG